MALSTTCCLPNLPPPSPPPPPTKTTQLVAWNKNEGSWRNRCVLGMTGVIMALEVGNWVAGETAAAVEMPLVVNSRSGDKIVRWSDERMCPQWRLNSLETIVPENLPRPTARRRWEAIRLPQTAPQLLATHKSSPRSRCFSM